MTPPDLQFIKAWMIRCGDLIWDAERERFAVVAEVESDPVMGLLLIGFEDETMAWYSRHEFVQIPTNRAQAHEWNQRSAPVADN